MKAVSGREKRAGGGGSGSGSSNRLGDKRAGPNLKAISSASISLVDGNAPGRKKQRK